MVKKQFDLKPKRGETEMVMHEEAKPLGFFGRLKIAGKLGISVKDIVLYLVLAAVAFGLAVLVTRYVAQRQEKKVTEQAQKAETETVATAEPTAPATPTASTPTAATESPTPLPTGQAGLPAGQAGKAAATPTVDKTSFKIRILNGNGVTGDAKKLAAALKEQGFQTGGVANSSGSYAKTQVWFLAGKDKEAEAVKAALTDRAVETKESTQAVIGKGYQILVITGAQ